MSCVPTSKPKTRTITLKQCVACYSNAGAPHVIHVFANPGVIGCFKDARNCGMNRSKTIPINYTLLAMGEHVNKSGFYGNPDDWKPTDSHHFRIPKQKRQMMINLLASKKYETGSYRDFDALFDHVCADAQAAGIVTSPNLWIYDICTRIGIVMSSPIEPVAYVYLFRGAMEGAKKWISIGLHWREKTVDLCAIRPELSVLSSADIENLLCIYK